MRSRQTSKLAGAAAAVIAARLVGFSLRVAACGSELAVSPVDRPVGGAWSAWLPSGW